MTRMMRTTINTKWDLWLPEHRHDRRNGDGDDLWPTWEFDRLAKMRELIVHFWNLDRTALVFDIGAEEGDLPALWASWGAQVVAVEPNPKVWPNIRACFDANGLRLAGWFCGFSAETTRRVEIGEASWDNGMAWPQSAFGEIIGDHGFLNLAERRRDVARTTIDELASKFGTPDVVTIDIEGAEMRAISGAIATMRQGRTHFLVSIHPEFMADMYPSDTPADLRALLERHGYESRHLVTDHEEHWHFVPPGA